MLKFLEKFISSLDSEEGHTKNTDKIFNGSAKINFIYSDLVDRFKNDYLDGPLGEEIPSYIKEQVNAELVSDTPETILKAIKIFELTKNLIKKNYLDSLILKGEQLVYKDDYGDFIFDSLDRELSKFVNDRFSFLSENKSVPKYYMEWSRHIIRESNAGHDTLKENTNSYDRLIKYLYHDGREFYESVCSGCVSDEMFEDLLYLLFLEKPVEEIINIDFSAITNPYEYESAVAHYLTQLGWGAIATSGSGDQGVDVIAENNGIKLVIQCKLYSQPVGNSSVQQVYSATGYVRGNISAVVTNSTYTKSARQLAESLGVHLLHHSELSSFTKKIFPEMDQSPLIDKTDADGKNVYDFRKVVAAILNARGVEVIYGISDDSDETQEINGERLTTYFNGENVQVFCMAKKEGAITLGNVAEKYKTFSSLKEEFDFSCMLMISTTGFSEEAYEYAGHRNNDLSLSDYSNLNKLIDEIVEKYQVDIDRNAPKDKNINDYRGEVSDMLNDAGVENTYDLNNTVNENDLSFKTYMMIFNENKNAEAYCYSLRKDPVPLEMVAPEYDEFQSDKAKYQTNEMYIFSKTGFTDEVLSYAERRSNDLILVSDNNLEKVIHSIKLKYSSENGSVSGFKNQGL